MRGGGRERPEKVVVRVYEGEGEGFMNLATEDADNDNEMIK